MSNTQTLLIPVNPYANINSIASKLEDRRITFAPGCRYAVVLASFYGSRKGYSTHRTAEAAIKASRRLGDISHQIISVDGTRYAIYNDRLVEMGKFL